MFDEYINIFLLKVQAFCRENRMSVARTRPSAAPATSRTEWDGKEVQVQPGNRPPNATVPKMGAASPKIVAAHNIHAPVLGLWLVESPMSVDVATVTNLLALGTTA